MREATPIRVLAPFVGEPMHTWSLADYIGRVDQHVRLLPLFPIGRPADIPRLFELPFGGSLEGSGPLMDFTPTAPAAFGRWPRSGVPKQGIGCPCLASRGLISDLICQRFEPFSELLQAEAEELSLWHGGPIATTPAMISGSGKNQMKFFRTNCPSLPFSD